MMKDFFPIDNPLCSSDGVSSPFTVTQNFSLVASAMFDFEYYKMELVNQFNNYIENTPQELYQYLAKLEKLQNQILNSNFNALQFSLLVNQDILQALIEGDEDINTYLMDYKNYLHPYVINCLNKKGTFEFNRSIIPDNIISHTKGHINNLQKKITMVEHAIFQLSDVITNAKKHMKDMQASYAAILEIESSLLEASQKILLDEETTANIAHMQHHHSSITLNEDSVDLAYHEANEDDEYGQFVEIEPQDSLLVYQSSAFGLFFDKAAFDLRAANSFVNEMMTCEADEGKVQQFYLGVFKTKN